MNKRVAELLHELSERSLPEEQREEVLIRLRKMVADSDLGIGLAEKLIADSDVLVDLMAFIATQYEIIMSSPDAPPSVKALPNPEQYLRRVLGDPHSIPFFFHMIPSILALADEAVEERPDPPIAGTPAKSD